MGMFDKFKDMIGIDGYEEEYYDDAEGSEGYDGSYYDRSEEEIDTDVSSRRHTGNIVPMKEKKMNTVSNPFKIVVIEPQDYDECPKLVDRLLNGRPLIVNVEKLDIDTARRIYDFLGGATYALNGNVRMIANNIYVFTPENVDIDEEGESQTYDYAEDNENEDYDPWN